MPGPQGFLPTHRYSLTAEQIEDNPVPRPGVGGGPVQQRFRSRSQSFPIQVEVFKIFSQSRVPQRLLQLLLDTLIKRVFALFPPEKVRRSRAPRGRNWVRSRVHGRFELSWSRVLSATTLSAARTPWGTTRGAASFPCC